MFPARHMVRAVRLAVLSLLFWIGLMPASAQIYSTAQGGTQYKGTYGEAYGSMNDGYYGSMEAQYEYNPYQSNVYKPGSSTPNTGLRKHHLSVHTPWSDSYAPMRTKKNSPTGETGGAIGEDEESENDPEGETGAPDGFITPSDPGHQSNQSPVGEAWVLLFFAAAAALAVFIRQKREKRHIAIYSEVQQPSDKSNMKQHIRKSLFISIILLAGVSNAWAGQRTIFLKPNSNWTQSSAWFSVYCFNNGEEWVKMTDNDNDGTYECLIDEKYSDIIFCRMKGTNQNSLDWNNVWNQTNDLKLQIQKGYDLYTIASGAWSNGSGVWSAFSLKADKTIYLKPNNDWKSDNAHFAVYAFNASENKWYSLNNVDCNGDYYSCTIEKKYHTVIFCRMSSSTNEWSNVWNQTGNIILLNNGKNTDQFNITDWGAGSWGTYSAPTYNITTNTPIGGTISVSPASSVAVNTPVTVTMIPNSGYKFRKGSIKIGNTEKESISTASSPHTICGPTEINAEFVTAGEQVVYLKPTNYWNIDSPTFAVHVWNNEGDKTAKDITMTPADCNGDYYTATIPAGYHSMVFYRKNTAGNDVWNKTADLEIPVNNNNCYTITSTGSGQNTPAAGSWGTFAPTYDVNVNITGKGSIIVDGETYTGTSEGTTTQKIEKITLNHTIKVGAITPAERWAYSDNATIKIGTNEQTSLAENSSHAICGPTNINITFKQTSCKITFDLHLPVGVDNESMMIDPQYVAPGEKAVKPSLREINDYLFGGWYKDKNCTQIYDFDAPVDQDITIHAKWVLYSQCIFFKNNLHWDHVYIYTFSDNVWYVNEDHDTKYGPGVCTKVNGLEFGEMTQLGESDIFYYILTRADGFSHIAFSDFPMNEWDEFCEHSAIYRNDRNDQLQLFVPQTDT